MDIVYIDFNNKIKIKLLNILKEIKLNYKKMFNPNNNQYNDLWILYNSINDLLIKNKYTPIDIPSENEYPFYEDYYLLNIKKDYKTWYKETSEIFNNKMLDTINIIDKYINTI